LPHLADFRTNVVNGCRAWRIQQVERAGKTEITMVIGRMFLLVGRRKRAAVGCVQAKLG
jgi:hypothetical protein